MKEKNTSIGKRIEGKKATFSSCHTAASRLGYTSDRKEERQGRNGRGSSSSTEKPAESARDSDIVWQEKKVKCIPKEKA